MQLEVFVRNGTLGRNCTKLIKRLLEVAFLSFVKMPQSGGIFILLIRTPHLAGTLLKSVAFWPYFFSLQCEMPWMSMLWIFMTKWHEMTHKMTRYAVQCVKCALFVKCELRDMRVCDPCDAYNEMCEMRHEMTWNATWNDVKCNIKWREM